MTTAAAQSRASVSIKRADRIHKNDVTGRHTRRLPHSPRMCPLSPLSAETLSKNISILPHFIEQKEKSCTVTSWPVISVLYAAVMTSA